MYCPAHFAETRPAQLRRLMRAHPLATLVTADDDGPQANLLPLLLDAPENPGDASEARPDAEGVRLSGHLPRANPLADALRRQPTVLVLFHGPSAYVSPNWYPSKQENHRAVPTWNYLTVQVRAQARVIDDPAWLRRHLAALSTHHETSEPHPWSLDDAPADFIDKLLGVLVGVELIAQSVQGKWKLSQNRPAHDRTGVAAALRQRAHPQDAQVADWMARLA